MDRIVILGGGVGGTLTANLLVKRLGKRLEDGRSAITLVDATGQHTYQPGFMYIAMGGERASSARRRHRSCRQKNYRNDCIRARDRGRTANIRARDFAPSAPGGSPRSRIPANRSTADRPAADGLRRV